MNTFHVKLITPQGVVYDKPIWQLSACNLDGRFSIRAFHIDFLTTLVACSVELAESAEKRERFEIRCGFLEFNRKNNGCTVICEKQL